MMRFFPFFSLVFLLPSAKSENNSITLHILCDIFNNFHMWTSKEGGLRRKAVDKEKQLQNYSNKFFDCAY